MVLATYAATIARRAARNPLNGHRSFTDLSQILHTGVHRRCGRCPCRQTASFASSPIGWRCATRSSGAAAQALRLTAKAFDVLCYLVEHAGQLVTKDELIRRGLAGAGGERGGLDELRGRAAQGAGRDRPGAALHCHGARSGLSLHRPGDPGRSRCGPGALVRPLSLLPPRPRRCWWGGSGSCTPCIGGWSRCCGAAPGGVCDRGGGHWQDHRGGRLSGHHGPGRCPSGWRGGSVWPSTARAKPICRCWSLGGCAGRPDTSVSSRCWASMRRRGWCKCQPYSARPTWRTCSARCRAPRASACCASWPRPWKW